MFTERELTPAHRGVAASRSADSLDEQIKAGIARRPRASTRRAR